jgi:hypothetical protein
VEVINVLTGSCSAMKRRFEQCFAIVATYCWKAVSTALNSKLNKLLCHRHITKLNNKYIFFYWIYRGAPVSTVTNDLMPRMRKQQTVAYTPHLGI